MGRFEGDRRLKTVVQITLLTLFLVANDGCGGGGKSAQSGSPPNGPGVNADSGIGGTGGGGTDAGSSDAGSSDAGSTGAGSTNVDQTLANCPTAGQVAAVDADLGLDFAGDPTVGQSLVCTAAGGSADLTYLQERTYNLFRVMKEIPFDAPFPWTNKTLYDWLIGAISGIRFRSDIGNVSFCCDPARVLNIQTQNLAAIASPTRSRAWLDPRIGTGEEGLLALLVHEARHSEGFPHTCGSNDQTIAEMGAWGVQHELLVWLGSHSGGYLRSPTDFPFPNYYQFVELAEAHDLCSGPTNRFCQDSCP